MPNPTRITFRKLGIRPLAPAGDGEAFDPQLLRVAADRVQADINQVTANVMATGKAHRNFVCQGCGKVHAMIYGHGVICGCGARSAAEILDPEG